MDNNLTNDDNLEANEVSSANLEKKYSSRKFALTKEQLKKLNAMVAFYYEDERNKAEAASQLVGEAVDFYFKNKYVEDITKLS